MQVRMTSGVDGSGDTKGYTLKLATDKQIGNGSFGVVYEARIVETGELVAIKKVLQDKRFKNRELQIMKQLHHPNIVALKHYFYQNGEKDDEVFLNLVMEFVPDTVYRVTRHYTKQRQLPPMIAVKLFVYQMCRSLAYLHSVGICHRDIKPQNLLVDAKSFVLKLCDFGSAKALIAGEPSVAYICSRYYRAPELIFGATDYTTAIDVWSAGCVAAELLLGHPLFPGDTGVDQLVEIIKVLGTPTREEVEAMNPSYTEFKFPSVKPFPWSKLFKPKPPTEALELITRMLTYVPSKRITAIEACAHPFFDELRDPATRLPDGVPLPALFNFTAEELKGVPREMREVLIPAHARDAHNWGSWAGPGAWDAVVPPAAAAAAASSGGGAGGAGIEAAREGAPSVLPPTLSTKHYPSGIDAATAGAFAAATR